MEKLLIINTGGTFNKRYNLLSGELEVPCDNSAIEAILTHAPNLSYEIISPVYKDSLEMTQDDRALIAQAIKNSPLDKIIIVHGTDTMDQTAAYLAMHIQDKTILLTGAMMPFSIDPIEATSNLMLAIGNLQKNEEKGLYIAMHGIVMSHEKIYKNRTKGIFQVHKD